MKEEVILRLSELKSMLNSIISQIQEGNATESKEIVSTLMNLPFVSVQGVLGEKMNDFLDYLELMSFMEREYDRENIRYTYFWRNSKHEWVEFRSSKGWYCHPALIALFEVYNKNI